MFSNHGWSCRTHPDAELRQVAFEKGSYKSLPPGDARRLRVGQVRPGEAAANPQLLVGAGTGFGEIEAVEIDILDPAGKRLRGVLDQFGGRAAENEETC